MNTHMKSAGLAIFLALSAAGAGGPGAGGSDPAPFVTFSQGHQTGTGELRFEGWKSAAENIRLAAGGERRMETKYDGEKPETYRQALNGLNEYRASVSNGMISFFEGESMSGAMAAEEGAFFFEPTSVSAYAFLLHRFSAPAGGKQTFQAIVTSQQDIVPVLVEEHGKNTFSAGGNSVDARHYRVLIGKRERAELWADGEAIVCVINAGRNFCAIAAPYAELYPHIDSILKRAL